MVKGYIESQNGNREGRIAVSRSHCTVFMRDVPLTFVNSFSTDRQTDRQADRQTKRTIKTKTKTKLNKMITRSLS